MITNEQILAVTKIIVDIVQPKQIYLFGSYANGTANSESDLDLLVIVNKSELPKRKRVEPIYLSLLKNKKMVNTDILVRTESEIEEWKNVSQAFLTSILPTAKLIYEG